LNLIQPQLRLSMPYSKAGWRGAAARTARSRDAACGVHQ
jgi:hypothetical protein